ncbi:hypothetical protein F5Y19DRAFT_491190 [Xylariaceae sp. FL1651]|nr:hypothetical protein F5Y19DRAFT_491190 [Xylariaceae sp. FL1651]
MSGLSEIPDDAPFEVRDAGDGKGLGVFARRDIRAGEVILVNYTSILYQESTELEDKVDAIIDLYENLPENEKGDWERLYAINDPALAEEYEAALLDRHTRSEEPPLDEDSVEQYVHLLMAAHSNAFEAREGWGGLFVEASRFNHSCDPNLWYETDEVYGRWVGRATRNIKQGEELYITYIPNCTSRNKRQGQVVSTWGFSCQCPLCIEGPDTYTASLEEARDIANGVEPDKNKPPPNFSNAAADMEQRHTRRIELLREIVEKKWDTEGDKASRKEYIFCLLDACDFQRHRFYERERAQDVLGMLPYLQRYLDYIREAKRVVDSVWPTPHQVGNFVTKHLAWAQKQWTTLDNESGGLVSEWAKTH